MPEGLRGKAAKTASGESICSGFNLGTCAVKGLRCPRGLHVCAEPGCEASHALPDHS